MRKFKRNAVAIIVLSAVSYGCDSAEPGSSINDPLSRSPSAVAPYLTEAAVAELQVNGQFRTDQLRFPSQPTLRPGEAVSLAQAFLHEYGPYILGQLERQHGQPIRLSDLQPIGRVIAAESPYEASPVSLPRPTAKHSGPFFIVTLGQSGTPAVSIAVSAYATDVSIVGERISFPRDFGNEFWFMGIPADGSFGSPIPPEEAVELVAVASGARATTTPAFVQRGRSWFPQYGSWVVDLDRPVRVRERISGRDRTTSRIHVLRDRSLQIAPEATDQRQHVQYLVDRERRETYLTFRDGLSSDLIEIDVYGSGGER